MVDAHLDAIFGAGMLDNASGSATILDIAEQMRKVNPRNKLRFIWFGGEELGLLGSAFYVNNLPPAELAKIGYDLDADVTATKNGDWAVLDPAADNLFGGTSAAVPRQRVRTVAGRSRPGGRLPGLDLQEPHLLLAGRHRRVQLQRRGHSGQRRVDGSGLLQDPGGGEPVRRLPRQLRGQRPRASTAGASTTRSAGATTSATTTRAC